MFVPSCPLLRVNTGHTEGGWAGTSRLDGGHLRMCAFEADVAGSGLPDECIDRPALRAGRSMSPVIRPGDHGWSLGGQPLPNQCLSRPATGGKFGREDIISLKERLGVGKQKKTGAGVSKSFIGFKAPIEPLIAPIPR